MAMMKIFIFFSVYSAATFWFFVDCDYTGKQILMHMSKAIGDTVKKCDADVDTDDDVVKDFTHFWEMDYPLKNELFGCVVYCVLLKLEVVKPDGSLILNNAQAFAHANGAGETQIVHLKMLYERCKSDLKFEFETFCRDGLAMANCFRTSIAKIGFNPAPGDFDPEW